MPIKIWMIPKANTHFAWIFRGRVIATCCCWYNIATNSHCNLRVWVSFWKLRKLLFANFNLSILTTPLYHNEPLRHNCRVYPIKFTMKNTMLDYLLLFLYQRTSPFFSLHFCGLILDFKALFKRRFHKRWPIYGSPNRSIMENKIILESTKPTQKLRDGLIKKMCI